MRAKRIKTGFHRVGLIIAAICGVPGVISALVALPVYLGWFHETRPGDDLWQAFLAGGAAGLALGALGYAAAWALGWVIAGFAGDEEISN